MGKIDLQKQAKHAEVVRRTKDSFVDGLFGESSWDPDAETKPKYERMKRKEARLEFHDCIRLSAIASEINERKPQKGEIITENTLIRIAVKHFLDQWRSSMIGSTEEEIRARFENIHQ